MATPIFRLLREKHPDAIVDLYSRVGGVLETLNGFGNRIPMREVPLKRVLTMGHDLIYWLSYEQSPDLHLLDGYEESTGLRLEDRSLIWEVLPEEWEKAGSLLEGAKDPLICFSPTSGHPLRSLDPRMTQTLVDLIQSSLGGTVVVTSDRPLNLSGCLDLSGRLSSIREVAAVIKRCGALLTVDSGPLHVAQALSIPSVGIFGCTLPELRVTRPNLLHAVRKEDLDCLGCYHRTSPYSETLATCSRGDLACMTTIEPELIIAALKEVLVGRPDLKLLARVEAYNAERDTQQALITPGRSEEIARTYRHRIAALATPSLLKKIERAFRSWRKGTSP